MLTTWAEGRPHARQVAAVSEPVLRLLHQGDDRKLLIHPDSSSRIPGRTPRYRIPATINYCSEREFIDV